MQLSSQQEIRILHVDDDPSITDLTGTFLEREDDQFAVGTATSADEGMEKLCDSPPDCVVSDYNMPGMDGIEFLQAVREEYPDLPFILFTGKGSETVASKAIAADVTDYLQKGSGSGKYELLANRIQNAVQARREAKRADRQEQLMRLTEFAGDTGGFELETDTGEVIMTDGTRRILNLSESANPNFEKNLQHYHPDDREDIRQTVQQALKTGEQTHGTWRYQHPDAEDKVLGITYTPVTTNGDTAIIRGAIHDITDRRERQQELRQLQQAIDNANVPITLADPSQEDDPLVYVNDGFEEMTGYPPEETLGRNCRFLQGEDTDPEKVATLRDAIDNEESVSAELRNYRKDGTEFWNRLTITPIYDDNGQLARYLGTQEDVTERKERERDLRAERRFIQQAIDSLDDLFYVIDTDGTLQRWNDQVPEVTGYDEQDLDGMQAIAFFSEDDRQTIAEGIETTLEDGRATVEGDLLTADGQRIPYELTGGRLTDTDGNPTGFVGIGRDLTERRQRRHRFRALVEESNDIISIVDADGRYQYQSPSIERILGYGPEETVGDTAWEYIHPDDRETVIKKFERWVRNPSSASDRAEYRARHADGSWRWMEAEGNDQFDNPAVEGYVLNSRDITERKERERKLARTHDLMANMEQLADVGAWEYDPETETLVMTDGTHRIYGLEPGADLTIEEAFEYFYPEDRKRLTDRFNKCLETGEPYEVDVRLTTTEGTQRWVTARGERITNSEDRRVARGYIQDITEQKRLEGDLEQERDLVTGIIDASPAGIIVVDADGDISFANEWAETILGWSRTEIEESTYDDSLWDLVNEHGEPYEDGDAPFDRIVTGERALRDHVVGTRRPSGDRVWLSLNAARQSNEDGELERVVCVLKDITEQRELEAEFTEIFGRVSDAFYALNDEFRFTHVNSRAEELLEAAEAELLGETVWEMFPKTAEIDTIRSAFHGAMDTQESHNFELYYEPLQGRFEVTVYPSESGVSVYFRDVTEQREYEQALEAQNKRLREFASIVSHDLRNPLQVAEGRLALIREECESDHIDDLGQALDRMDALITDLLTLAREGEQIDETDPVGLANAAENSWQTVNTEQATLETHETRTLRADRSRLQELVENLYCNAIEHGGDDVTVSVDAMDGGFYVADTGPGVHKSDREEVFETGYSTTEDGTGFGLRIVEQIADAHGWEVTVTESEHGGARFEITGVEFADR